MRSQIVALSGDPQMDLRQFALKLPTLCSSNRIPYILLTNMAAA
jgi:ribosomal protein L7Ae-like RNA K-turn-binding protein